jgi:hypothetical protein
MAGRVKACVIARQRRVEICLRLRGKRRPELRA